jgi:hypothetical protein
MGKSGSEPVHGGEAGSKEQHMYSPASSTLFVHAADLGPENETDAAEPIQSRGYRDKFIFQLPPPNKVGEIGAG